MLSSDYTDRSLTMHLAITVPMLPSWSETARIRIRHAQTDHVVLSLGHFWTGFKCAIDGGRDTSVSEVHAERSSISCNLIVNSWWCLGANKRYLLNSGRMNTIVHPLPAPILASSSHNNVVAADNSGNERCTERSWIACSQAVRDWWCFGENRDLYWIIGVSTLLCIH